MVGSAAWTPGRSRDVSFVTLLPCRRWTGARAVNRIGSPCGVPTCPGGCMAEAETIITLENVYKIFGPNPRGRAFDLCQAGVGKDEIQRQTGHVVGMKDISFEVKKGEIFVVMGLDRKSTRLHSSH